MTGASGFSACKRSMFARTERRSTSRFAMIMRSRLEIFTTMLFLSGSTVLGLSSSGWFTSKPTSLTKVAVTMKKINMMNTTSSIGVRVWPFAAVFVSTSSKSSAHFSLWLPQARANVMTCWLKVPATWRLI